MLPIAVSASLLFVIRRPFVCGEFALATTTTAAAAAAASASLGFRLSSSLWFACCFCDTCLGVAATYYSYDMIPRVRIYMLRSSAVVVLTRVYVATPRHTRQLRAVALSIEGATSIWCCSVHVAAVTSCERWAGPTRTFPVRSKRKAARTDVLLMIPPAPFFLAILA